MKKLTGYAIVMSLVAFAAFSQAATVTNQGQVITVNTLDAVADAGTVTEDQSTYATPTAREGLIVAHCVVPANYTNGMLFGPTIPKGAILSEIAYIEVATGVGPGTNLAINVGTAGGIAVVATGTNSSLNTTGIKAAVPTALMTTNAAQLYLSNSGLAHTGGTFTVYLPYILGNAGR